jgi:hypothetical protein
VHTQEFDVESIMLLDENELKEMEIPRGPRLKILNRIKAGNGVNTTNLSTSGGGGPSSASISRTSSASLNSSAESSVVDDAGAGSFTPPPTRHDLLNPLDLEEVAQARRRQARLSWGPTPEGESPGGSPRSSPSSPLHSSPHPMAEDSSSVVAGGAGVTRKFKRDSGEMRRKLAEVQRSPGRSNHSNAFLKKSVSDLEDQMSASDGYRPRYKRRTRTHATAHGRD